MTVILRHNIVTGFVVLDGKRPDQLRLDEYIQRVIYGGFRQSGDFTPQCAENLVDSGMTLILDQVFQDQHSLMRGSDISIQQFLGKEVNNDHAHCFFHATHKNEYCDFVIITR